MLFILVSQTCERMCATPMGWLMYGLPSGSFLFWPLCFNAAKLVAVKRASNSPPAILVNWILVSETWEREDGLNISSWSPLNRSVIISDTTFTGGSIELPQSTRVLERICVLPFPRPSRGYLGLFARATMTDNYVSR